MANIQHKDIPEAQLHEPKGASTSTVGQVVFSTGAASDWGDLSDIATTGAAAGEMLVANGSGGSTYQQPHGWGNYKDNAAAQTFTTTAAKLSIDGAGSTTEIGYLPSDVTALWDTTADKMLASGLGDSYLIRLDLPITAVTGSASILELEVDIGGGATPSIVIVNSQISVAAGINKVVSVSFGLFSLSTFVTNGAQLFLKTDANTVQVTTPGILIQRVSKG
jgi:hypothetical protein